MKIKAVLNDLLDIVGCVTLMVVLCIAAYLFGPPKAFPQTPRTIATFDQVNVNGQTAIKPTAPLFQASIVGGVTGTCVTVGTDLSLVAGQVCGISVSTFGAKGDGVNDDTAAIGSAAMAVNASGGGILTFPCGHFLIASSINSPPGNRALLYLNLLSNVTLQGSGSCTWLDGRILNRSTLEIINGNNVHVTNMRIDAVNGIYVENYGLAGGSAVKLSNCQRCEVSHVEVQGASASAIYFTNGTSYSTASYNYVHSTMGSGMIEDNCGAVSATDCSPGPIPFGNTYANNTFSDAGLLYQPGGVSAHSSLGLDDGGNTTASTITGNKFYFPSAASINPSLYAIGAGTAKNVIVSNNYINASPSDGIAIVNGFAGSVTGNVIAGAGAQGIIYYADSGTADPMSITGNVITSSGAQGIYIGAGSGASSATVVDVNVSGNTVLNTANTFDSIYVQQGTRVNVTGNNTTGGAYGVHFGPSVGSITLGTNNLNNYTTGNVLDESHSATSGLVGFTGTKTAGACVLTFSSGVLLSISGC